jgi:hypothetical protein
LREPDISPGSALTVSPLVDIQPEPNEYVMVTLPAVTPHASPVVLFTVATDGLLLVQKPPDVELERVVQEPTHTLVGPEIAPGKEFTVITLVSRQPVGIA